MPPHPTPGGRHIPDKTTADLVMGVKNGFWFWPGMWRGPKKLARTIVRGIKGGEGKRGEGGSCGGGCRGRERGSEHLGTTAGDVFLSPRDWQTRSGYTGSLKLKGAEAVPQAGQK